MRFRSSCCQESRVLSEVGNLFHSKAHERLAQHLEEGGEVLLQKVLNFIEYGLLQDAAGEDLHKPFHRNTRTFANLSLEQLKIIMQSFHGNLWAEQLARRTRLPQMRQLLYFALRVDPGDYLPEKNLYDLVQTCKPRYEKREPLIINFCPR
jgi:hypothetical protein